MRIARSHVLVYNFQQCLGKFDWWMILVNRRMYKHHRVVPPNLMYRSLFCRRRCPTVVLKIVLLSNCSVIAYACSLWVAISWRISTIIIILGTRATHRPGYHVKSLAIYLFPVWSSCFQIFEITKFFLVPTGASRNKMPPVSLSSVAQIVFF